MVDPDQTRCSWRTWTGLVLAAGVIAVGFPLAPWNLRTLLERSFHLSSATAGLLVHLVLLLGLALSALLVASRSLGPRPDWNPGRATGLALGWLLMLEPLLALVLLEVVAWHPDADGIGLVFSTGGTCRLTSGVFWTQVVVLIVATPVVEEWFFRGRLLPLLAGRIGPVSAISATSLLFAAGHGGVVSIACALPIGVLLGLLRLGTGRLYPCVAAHALHNALCLTVGGSLTASPTILLIILMGGALLLGSTWVHEAGHHRLRRRSALALAVVLAASLAWWPLVGYLHDLAWCHAAMRLLFAVSQEEMILGRLAGMADRGEVTSLRRQHLVQLAQARMQHRPDRALAILAIIDAETANRSLVAGRPATEAAAGALRILIRIRLQGPAQAAAGRAIAHGRPEALATVIGTEHPTMLAAWFPLPESDRELARLVSAMEGQDRAATISWLLTGQVYPIETVAAALMQMPRDRITGRDRYQLRMKVNGFDRLLADLKASDPTQATAWE